MVDNKEPLFIESQRSDQSKMKDASLSLVLMHGPQDSSGVPFLFVGSKESSQSLKELQDNQITHILICAKFFKPSFDGQFEYKQLDMVDKPDFNIAKCVQQGIEFIQECKKTENGRVLLHCSLGKSRACTMAIAYVMQELGIGYDEAFEHVKARRPCC